MKNVKKMTLLTMAAGGATLGMGTDASADEQYTIQKGDTLTRISKLFGTTIDQLAEDNQIENIHYILAGDSLRITSDRKVVAPADAKASAKTTQTIQTIPNPATNMIRPTEAQAQAPVQSAPVAPQTQGNAQVAPTQKQKVAPIVPETSRPTGGSTYAQFIAAGGTHAMWKAIVMPESSGNPHALSPNGYRGLGQTKEPWGTGSVYTQTQGMLNYAVKRYGSVENAIAFRQANGWW